MPIPLSMGHTRPDTLVTRLPGPVASVYVSSTDIVATISK